MTEDDRYLCNWLSSRVDQYGAVLVGYEHEAAAIARLYAKAQSKGLQVVPGHYIPRPTGKRVGDTSTGSLTCVRCDVTYANSHFHCCRCHRVFRTARTFERHQEAAELASNQVLEKMGLRMWKDGVWAGKPMAEETKVKLNSRRGMKKAV